MEMNPLGVNVGRVQRVGRLERNPAPALGLEGYSLECYPICTRARRLLPVCKHCMRRPDELQVWRIGARGAVVDVRAGVPLGIERKPSGGFANLNISVGGVQGY